MQTNKGPVQRIRERALELLEAYPNGLNYSIIWPMISKSDPDLDTSTITTQVSALKHHAEIYQPKRGIYCLVKYKSDSAQPVTNNPRNPFLSTERLSEDDVQNVYQEDSELQTSDIEPPTLSALPSNPDSRSLESWYEENERRVATLDRNELARRAAMASPVPQKIELAATTVFIRDPYVAKYAKMLADGACDLCKKPAPFLTLDSEPYLESHHVTWLSRGGYDLIENVVALCPNCHRKMHSRDEEADREHLLYRIASRHQL